MKNYLLFFSLILFSCSNSNIKGLEGSWTDKKTESSKINITAMSDKLLFEIKGKKYPIIENDKNLNVSINGENHAIIFDEKQSILLFNGKEFILEKNGVKSKFIGTWYNSIHGGNEFFEIKEVNNRITVVLNSAYMGKSRYYPEIVDGNLVYTMKNGIKSMLKLDGDCISDTADIKYCKEIASNSEGQYKKTDKISQNIVKSSVENLRVRSLPKMTAEVIGKMEKNEVGKYLQYYTTYKTPVNIDGVEYNEPWYKVKLKNGKTGWVNGCCAKLFWQEKVY